MVPHGRSASIHGVEIPRGERCNGAATVLASGFIVKMETKESESTDQADTDLHLFFYGIQL